MSYPPPQHARSRPPRPPGLSGNRLLPEQNRRSRSSTTCARLPPPTAGPSAPAFPPTARRRCSPRCRMPLRSAQPHHLHRHHARLPDRRTVAVVSAGTSDLPVAEEAAATLAFLGHPVTALQRHRRGRHPPPAARIDEIRSAAWSSSSPAWKARCPASSADWFPPRSSPCPPASATARPSKDSPPSWACSTPAPPASPWSTSTTASAPPWPPTAFCTTNPSNPMKTAYFDCIAGASGDMLLGALVDAGLPAAALEAELAKLHIR
jgi:hypothetical protein